MFNLSHSVWVSPKPGACYAVLLYFYCLSYFSFMVSLINQAVCILVRIALHLSFPSKPFLSLLCCMDFAHYWSMYCDLYLLTFTSFSFWWSVVPIAVTLHFHVFFKSNYLLPDPLFILNFILSSMTICL